MVLPVIELRLNGILMPAPLIGGVTLELEPVWSKNTGRNARYTMVGTVGAEKYHGAIKWPPLTEGDYAVVQGNTSRPGRPWISVDLTMADRSVLSFQAYTGSLQSALWEPVGGEWRRSGVTLPIIER